MKLEEEIRDVIADGSIVRKEDKYIIYVSYGMFSISGRVVTKKETKRFTYDGSNFTWQNEDKW